MSNQQKQLATIQSINEDKIYQIVVAGNLGVLTDAEKTYYCVQLCKALGLNRLTQPFKYIKMQGKEVLYATKDCTDQLCKLYGISRQIVRRELVDEVYSVFARATNREGRTDEDVGVVSLAGLKGLDRANAIMKAETKAKRRVSLSISGLGFLDETEVEDMNNPNSKRGSSDFIQDLKNQKLVASEPISAALEAEALPLPTPNESEAPKNDFEPKVSTRESTNVKGLKSPAEYVFDFGQMKGHKISEFSIERLEAYADRLRESAEKNGEVVSGAALGFLKALEEYKANANSTQAIKNL
jgi:hypothetical protein